MKGSKGSFFKKSKTNTNDKPVVSMSGKWECPGCGALNSESARYCASCGHSK